MNVLFLVMEFAPVNTTGNFRSLKFVKYLKEFGINPIVVTLNEDDGAQIFNAPINNDLLNDITPGTTIYRIRCAGVKKNYTNRISEFISIYFSVVDSIGKTWKKELFKNINAIVDLHKPEAIYTSLPPFSSGLLATTIAKKFDIPLVVDMRDLWAYWGSDPNGSYIHFAIKKAMEGRVFAAARKIIGATPQLIKIFSETHPNVNANKFHWIPNGYDSELFELNTHREQIDGDKYIIGYVGSFYYSPESHNNAMLPWWKKKGHRKLQYSPLKENWLYRSPYFFFRALAHLLKSNPEFKQKVRFDFVGRQPDWLLEMLNAFNLQDVYHYHGFKTHKETLEIQNNFNAFLATSEKVIDGEHYCLPSKTFDYIQKQKPILAFVTPGVQKDFLIDSGLAILCDPDNVHESAMNIKAAIEGKYKLKPNLTTLKQYHRKLSSQKLAGLFYSLNKE